MPTQGVTSRTSWSPLSLPEAAASRSHCLIWPTESVPDDYEVGEGFSAGADWALAEAYRRWSPLVYTMSLRALGDRTDAEDVTQQVLIKAWQSRDRFDRERGSLASWLVEITKHAINDKRSARDRDRRLAERTATLAAPASVPWSESDRIADSIVVHPWRNWAHRSARSSHWRSTRR